MGHFHEMLLYFEQLLFVLPRAYKLKKRACNIHRRRNSKIMLLKIE